MTLAVPVSSIAVARAILAHHFPGVKIASKVPNPLPARCIRVTRAGGPKDWAIDHPYLLVECWNLDSVQAEQDALTAYTALEAANRGGPYAGAYVSGWDGNTIVDFPDPDVPQARWQFTGQLHLIIRTSN